jgi:hypothetical protein
MSGLYQSRERRSKPGFGDGKDSDRKIEDGKKRPFVILLSTIFLSCLAVFIRGIATPSVGLIPTHQPAVGTKKSKPIFPRGKTFGRTMRAGR